MAEYAVYLVEGTNHFFSAPKLKYDNIKADLGLTDISADDAKKENAVKLAPGYGYILLKAKLKKVGNKPSKTVTICCSQNKVGTVLKNGLNNKINNTDVDRIYVPTSRYRR